MVGLIVLTHPDGPVACTVPESIASSRQTICPARDIMTNGAKDNTDAPCDAISFGAGFDTYPVSDVVRGVLVAADAGCPPIGDCE